MASRIEPEGGWQCRLKPFRTPRVRDNKHLRRIRLEPCCICRSSYSQAAHIRAGSIEYDKEPAGYQEKSDDRWTVPLCDRHHREQHSMNEMKFWERYGRDPFALAISYVEKFATGGN